jgi:hypothetical protein
MAGRSGVVDMGRSHLAACLPKRCRRCRLGYCCRTAHEWHRLRGLEGSPVIARYVRGYHQQ